MAKFHTVTHFFHAKAIAGYSMQHKYVKCQNVILSYGSSHTKVMAGYQYAK